MGTTVWYLFMLVPVIAIAYVIWAYRKRAADKEALSRERFANLVGVPHPAGAPGQQPVAAVAAQPAATAAPAAAVSLLTPPERLLYYVLKAGLPGHEVFPRVSIAAVLVGRGSAPGPAYETPARRDLDFVVCDKEMRVVAAVLLEGEAARQDAGPLSRALASAGIRVVKINAAALPRREQVRAVIYGP